jgi:acid phosphatase (class A)
MILSGEQEAGAARMICIASNRSRLLHRGAASVLLAAAVFAPGLASAQPPSSARTPGYLTADQVADSIRFLGPPPAADTGAKKGDVETYQATRRLEGTPRWSLAARDDSVGAAQMAANFSCALGVRTTPQTAPALFHLFTRLVPDTGLAVGAAKAFYKRPRPFVEKGGKVCIVDRERDALGKTYSYPSGHSTYGWLTGLVMAQIAPDRATDVLARARSFGESRVVCGVHYESDVEAGRVAASGVFAALQSSEVFLADVQAARAELAQRRANPETPDPAECAIEAKASAEPVW